jgi:hypothetical protein
MKKLILPVFIISVFFTSYATGKISHWIKLRDGEKSLIKKSKELTYDEVIHLNKKGEFKSPIDPEDTNYLVKVVEVTRKKGILGWETKEEIKERYVKSISKNSE